MLILRQAGDQPIAYLCGQEPFCRMVGYPLYLIYNIIHTDIAILHWQNISSILIGIALIQKQFFTPQKMGNSHFFLKGWQQSSPGSCQEEHWGVLPGRRGSRATWSASGHHYNITSVFIPRPDPGPAGALTASSVWWGDQPLLRPAQRWQTKTGGKDKDRNRQRQFWGVTNFL